MTGLGVKEVVNLSKDLLIKGLDKSACPKIYLSKVWISQPFQTGGELIHGIITFTFFNGRLTSMLLWMQWISLLDVELCAVFYMYVHVVC